MPLEWLSPGEEALWRSNVRYGLPLYSALAVFWLLVRAASTFFWESCRFWNVVPSESKTKWHNDMTTSSFAWLAVATAAYALFVLDELDALEERRFAASNAHYIISGVGFSYFVYDLGYLCWTREFGYAGAAVLLHHFLFIFSYTVSMLYPSTASMRGMYYWCLTDASTIPLHLVWFFEKAQVTGLPLIVAGFTLVAVFGVRCFLGVIALYHQNTLVFRHDLWSFPTPPQLAAAFPSVPWPAVVRAYVFVHTFFPWVMAALNFYWWSKVVSRGLRVFRAVSTSGRP